MKKNVEYFQKTFLSGMNQQVDPTRLQGDSYFLAVNARVRKDVVEPTKSHKDLTALIPQGKLQGIYAANQFGILFVDGKAYLKNFEDDNTGFNVVSNLQLDSNVDYIYGQLVPASTLDYGRASVAGISPIATNATQENGVIISPDIPNIANTGNPAVGVFQDGLNQPWAINSDGQAFKIQSFDEWNLEKREYVPIGKQMAESNGVLYLSGKDQKTIFRSVSGRFLDFVVAIDQDGNKLGNGDSTNISPKVAFNNITCLSPSGSGVFVGYREVSYLLNPNLSKLAYGEPTFTKTFLFTTGPLNQFSSTDLNGDLAFIDYGGIRSFNATKQTEQESNNTPISAPIARFFSGVTQNFTCCGEFDDYALFAVNTVYGYGVIVYDKMLEKFVSFDQFSSTISIKQFAVIKTSKGRKLLFITSDNKLYEANAGNSAAGAKIYIGEWCSNNPAVEQKTLNLQVVFTDASSAGTLTATIFEDGKKGQSETRTIEQRIFNPSINQVFPYGNTDKDRVQNIGINFKNSSKRGFKVGFLLEWNCLANLSHIRVETETNTQRSSSIEQQASSYANAS